MTILHSMVEMTWVFQKMSFPRVISTTLLHYTSAVCTSVNLLKLMRPGLVYVLGSAGKEAVV